MCAAVEGADDMELVGRADPALGVSLEQALDEVEPDVVVDFTVPDTVFENARLCLEHGTHVVVGTTGLAPEQVDELRAAAERSEGNCLIAPNFAIGAVLMMEAAKLIAPHMPDCEIVELHHEAKLDAPSGTAKRTAELIEEAGGRKDPPIHSVRLPGLVAESGSDLRRPRPDAHGAPRHDLARVVHAGRAARGAQGRRASTAWSSGSRT